LANKEKLASDTEILLMAKHYVLSRCTVRDVARVYSFGKSTVHRYFVEFLPNINTVLSAEVNELLLTNKKERARRGGYALRAKRRRKK
jgi:hypothetical protein